MPRPDLIFLQPSGFKRPAYSVRLGQRVLVLAALALTAGLSACSDSMMEARPVCIKPHGGANYQLAPRDHPYCKSGMHGHVMVNQ